MKRRQQAQVIAGRGAGGKRAKAHDGEEQPAPQAASPAHQDAAVCEPQEETAALAPAAGAAAAAPGPCPSADACTSAPGTSTQQQRNGAAPGDSDAAAAADGPQPQQHHAAGHDGPGASTATPAAAAGTAPGAAGPITPEVPATTPLSLGQTHRRNAAAAAEGAPLTTGRQLSQQARRRAALLLLDSVPGGVGNTGNAAEQQQQQADSSSHLPQQQVEQQQQQQPLDEGEWAASVLQKLEARLAAVQASTAGKQAQRKARLLGLPEGGACAEASSEAAATCKQQQQPAADAPAAAATAAQQGSGAALAPDTQDGGAAPEASDVPEASAHDAAAAAAAAAAAGGSGVAEPQLQQPRSACLASSNNTSSSRNPAQRRAALLLMQAAGDADVLPAPDSSWQLFKPLLAEALGVPPAAVDAGAGVGAPPPSGQPQPAAGTGSLRAQRRAQLLGLQQQGGPEQPAAAGNDCQREQEPQQQTHKEEAAEAAAAAAAPKLVSGAAAAAAAAPATAGDLATPVPFSNMALTPSTAPARRKASSMGLAALQMMGQVDSAAATAGTGGSGAAQGAAAPVTSDKPPSAPADVACRVTSVQRQALKRPGASSARARALQLGGGAWMQSLMSMAGFSAAANEQQESSAAAEPPVAAPVSSSTGHKARRRAHLLLQEQAHEQMGQDASGASATTQPAQGTAVPAAAASGAKSSSGPVPAEQPQAELCSSPAPSAAAGGRCQASPLLCSGGGFVHCMADLIDSLAPSELCCSPAGADASSAGGDAAGDAELPAQQQERASPETPVMLRTSSCQQLVDGAAEAMGHAAAPEVPLCTGLKSPQQEQPAASGQCCPRVLELTPCMQQRQPSTAAVHSSKDTVQQQDQAVVGAVTSPADMPAGSGNAQQRPSAARQQQRPSLGSIAQRRAALLSVAGSAPATDTGSSLQHAPRAADVVGGAAAPDSGPDAGSRDADQSSPALAFLGDKAGAAAATSAGLRCLSASPQLQQRNTWGGFDSAAARGTPPYGGADASPELFGSSSRQRLQQQLAAASTASPASRACFIPAAALVGISRTMVYVRTPAAKQTRASKAGRGAGSSGSLSGGGIMMAAPAALLNGELPDGAGTAPVKETLEQAVVAAHLDLQLATAAAAGETWAGCDLAGLPLDPTAASQQLQACKDRYADVRARLVRCRQLSDVSKLDRQLAQEWQWLRGMRQRAVDAAQQCNKQGILRKAPAAGGSSSSSPPGLPGGWVADSAINQQQQQQQASTGKRSSRIRFSLPATADVVTSPVRSSQQRKKLLLSIM